MKNKWILVFLLFSNSIDLISQEFIIEPTNGYEGGELFDFTVHENTLYSVSLDGVIKSIDMGNSWHIILNLPFDEAYHSNDLNAQLAANDEAIFVAYKKRTDGELIQFLKRSTDNGLTWLNIYIPEGVFINGLDINDNFLYVNNHYLKIDDPIFTFYPKQEPLGFNKRFYQNEYVIVYNSDSLYFSEDNLNWTYKPMPPTPPCSSPGGLAIIGQTLYVSHSCNLFKSTLTDDQTYTTLNNTFSSGKIASDNEYLYYRWSNVLLEINTLTLDTFIINGSTWGIFDKIRFTDEYAFVENFSLGLTSNQTNYQPIVRFERYTHLQSDQIGAIRSSLDRENTFKLVQINGELFSCNPQGLHRYSEDNNTWNFIETPFLYNTSNIAWGHGYYYIASGSNLYRTSNFEEWEHIPVESGEIYSMFPYHNDMLFFGLGYLGAFNETTGSRIVNEIADFNNGGTYPRQYKLLPPDLHNDTIVAYSDGDMFYSPDGGETWDMFFNNFQSHYGYPEQEEIYYFKRYFNTSNNKVNVSFIKKDKYTPVFDHDYESAYSGSYYQSVANNLYFHFLKSGDLLFFSLPGVGVIFSKDDGENWELLSNDISLLYITSMEATDNYVFFASKQHGIQRFRKDQITSNNQPSIVSKLKIFPNPTTEKLNFNQYKSGIVYDLSGREIITFSDKSQLNTISLPNGMYFIKFQDDHNTPAQIFIKQ